MLTLCKRLATSSCWLTIDEVLSLILTGNGQLGDDLHQSRYLTLHGYLLPALKLYCLHVTTTVTARTDW